MLIQRLCTLADLPEIERLAIASPVGITSLPADPEQLAVIIEGTEAAMDESVTFTGEERYFFVLEDLGTGCLAGCSSIMSAAGFSQPFHTFRNDIFVHASRELSLHNRTHVLSLCHDLTGHSLLTGFYLDSPWKGNYATLKLNACGRLLFMASHPQRFADSTAVEMSGISDEQGNAPFWDGLGRHFFDVDYREAERLSSRHGRSMLAELMPGYPIYVSMLPDAAQEAIGQVRPASQLVYDILLQEGFESENYVDIFDGGPVVQARTAELTSVRYSETAMVRIGQPGPATGNWLVANERIRDFRACLCDLAWQPGEPLTLGAQMADLLKVTEGDTLRLIGGA
ncbi:arginine succinyltransferase [Halopseudomonas litoralis]|uniref:Arginine succinyltransferase n=1 Tax=Halopseudomonas litoralis TaxID=797277 RepID=A0A1H1T5F8_9GAMM|nr:arginine N-succinyltransferase [Halopseudomonas litoralis]SDS54869.1 arginine succinyltransferase [Halopseudomonas litoralis]